jgi:hypothetical protein
MTVAAVPAARMSSTSTTCPVKFWLRANRTSDHAVTALSVTPDPAVIVPPVSGR